MNIAAAIAVSILLLAGSALAQQTLVGKYSGSFSMQDNRGQTVTGITLEILTVEGDTVSAKAVRERSIQRSPCAGEYRLEGKLKGNALALKSISGPGSGDCSLSMRLTVDGNKLAGTINKWDAQLTK